jgi:hypothetical protein
MNATLILSSVILVVLVGCNPHMPGPDLPEYDGTSITPEMDFCYKRNYSFVWIDNGWSAGCLTEEGPTRISKIMYFERKLMTLLPDDYDFSLDSETGNWYEDKEDK